MQRLAREQESTPRDGQQPQNHAGNGLMEAVPWTNTEGSHGNVLERLARLEGFVSAQQNRPGVAGTFPHAASAVSIMHPQTEQQPPKTPNPDEQVKKLLVGGAVGIARTVRRLTGR